MVGQSIEKIDKKWIIDMGGELKMKKLLAAVMMLAVVIGLAACNTDKNASTDTTKTAAVDAKAVLKAKCSTCHGQNLEGVIGPKLSDVGARLSKEQISTVVKSGRTGAKGAMPGGLLTDQKEFDAVVEYLANAK